MPFFSKMFIRGLLTLLPLILTIYPLYYFFHWSDKIAKQFLHWILPGISYIPGTGIIVGVLCIFLLGLLMSTQFVSRLFGLIELPIKNIPLVKSLYSAIKSLISYLAPTGGRKAEKVVVVKVPGTDAEIIGFIVQEDLSGVLKNGKGDNKVAVYIPLSYQIGGFTFFLPRDWLTPTEIHVEEAMKNVLMGWMVKEEKN